MHRKLMAAVVLSLLSTLAAAEDVKQYDAAKLYADYEKADPMEVITKFAGPLVVSGTVARTMESGGKALVSLKTDSPKKFVQIELPGAKIKAGQKVSARCEGIAGLAEDVLQLTDCAVKK